MGISSGTSIWRWFVRRRKRLGSIALAVFIGINLLAYLHARAMTHFVDGGARTAPPEKLSGIGKIGVLFTGVRLPRPMNTLTPADAGLPFETRTFLSSDGTKLESWLIPANEPCGICLLFHGYGGCKSALVADAKAFHEIGFDCLLVDFRGSGGSAGNMTTIGYREADDVAATVDYAKANLPARPIVLYGESMGAAAILRAVGVNHVDASAVIIESPFDRLLSTVENRFRTIHVPPFPMAHLLVFWGGLQNGYSGFKHNPADYAKDVHIPVLMMHGRHDSRVTVQQAQTIFDNLPGKKKLVVFENASHLSFLSADPKLWRAQVADFLSSTATK